MTATLEILPLLSLVVLTPLAGAALVWLARSQRQARAIALGMMGVDLLLALAVLARFDSASAAFQLVERAVWIPTLNVHYLVGVDGISVLFLPLTAALFAGTVIASWTSVRTMPRLYYALVLLLASATLGIFVALDTLLFFLFWELTLIPLYFLVSLWGIGPHRRYAAVKYTMVMLVGGVPLLFGFLLLAFDQANVAGARIPDGLVFDYLQLVATPLPVELQYAVFLLLLVGFAVKAPVFPFHTWLPVVAMEGPAAITALLTGLKLGAYGILRFAVPLAPQAAHQLHWLLAGLGVVGILYGALAALAQTNLRRMLAYSSISHVGLVILGISAFNAQGVQGALFLLLNFTVVAGGLFLLTAFLHHRIGSTEAVSLGGAAQSMPLLASFYLLLGLAGMGVPLTSGFPAEHLIVIGTLQVHLGAGLAALFGAVLTAAYFLALYRRAFLGPMSSAVVAAAVDLQPRELALAGILATLVLLAGLYPAAVLELTRPAVEGWIAIISSAAPGR
jgi:NADH-quinone oxidoreductase subunit M